MSSSKNREAWFDLSTILSRIDSGSYRGEVDLLHKVKLDFDPRLESADFMGIYEIRYEIVF